MQWHQILTDGGMGDLICELVAVDYNIRQFKKVEFLVWVPDYMLDFARHVLPHKTKINPFSIAKIKFNDEILGTTTEWCTPHTCMRTHPVDYGFHMLSDRHLYDINQKNYLQIRPKEISNKFDLPQDYIVLASAAAEPVKEMPIETANSVIDFCLQHNYTPVFLGKERSECGLNNLVVKAKPIKLNYNKGINLLNKTDLLQASLIMSKAKVVIGMDGGLIHLAGCTQAEIIAGYTLVDPIHVAPIRHGTQTFKFQAVEPDLDIENRYFQTYGGFSKGDYRKFPGWEKVIANMTPDKFIKALDKVLC